MGFQRQVCSQETPPLGATIRMKRGPLICFGSLFGAAAGRDEVAAAGPRGSRSRSPDFGEQISAVVKQWNRHGHNCVCRSQTVECRLLLQGKEHGTSDVHPPSSPKRRRFAVAGTPLSCDDIRGDRWLSQGDLQLEGPRPRLLRRLGGVESNHVLPRPANAEGSPRIAVADRADMRIPASGFPCEGQQEAVRLQCAGQGHPITPRSNIRPRGCVHYGMAGSSKSRESLCRMQYPGAKFPVHTADVITHRCFSQLTVICGTPEAPGTPRICSVRLAQVDAVCSRF